MVEISAKNFLKVVAVTRIQEFFAQVAHQDPTQIWTTRPGRRRPGVGTHGHSCLARVAVSL